MFVDDETPIQWQALEWFNCECGSLLYAPITCQGGVCKWALCSSSSCRKTWKLSAVDRDIEGTLDGVMPEQIHSRMIV
jgi:hypothetical protein